MICDGGQRCRSGERCGCPAVARSGFSARGQRVPFSGFLGVSDLCFGSCHGLYLFLVVLSRAGACCAVLVVVLVVRIFV